MYCDFYQLRERPFNVTADPKFLYLNARYREALASLNYGISQRKGFITLIGEAGTGKTTLLKKLLDDLDSSTRTVFIFNTNVTFNEILEYIFGEFDLPVHNGKRLYMLQRLNTFLLEELRNGRNVALLIDEAQDLDYSVLEDLRLLSNLETAKEKILQIVLSGQPELGQKLGNPGLRQLRQRVAVNCRLLPLTREEITEYIQSRLTAAGSVDPRLFTRDAEDRIFEISMGIPRLVNIVCDNALVIGYALGKKRIGADVVNEAAADLLSIESRPAEAESPEPVAAPTPEPSTPRNRNLSQLGFVALVVVAILIGLLSVGRSLLRHDGQDEAMVDAGRLQVVPPAERVIEESARALNPAGPAVGPRVAEPPAAMIPEQGRAPSAAAASGRQPAAEAAAPEDPAAGEWQNDGSPAGAAPVAETGGGNDAEAEEYAQEPRRSGKRELASVQDDDSDDGETAGGEARRGGTRPAAAAAAAAIEDAFVDAQAEGDATTASEPAEEGGEYSLAMSSYDHVRVKPGDSVSEIASNAYGQASATILDIMKMANPSIRDIDVISAGQDLRIPRLNEGFVVLHQPEGRYALLLMSTPFERRAQDVKAALRRHGFDAVVRTADFGSGVRIQRVLISDIESRERALSVGKELQKLFRDDERIAAMAR